MCAISKETHSFLSRVNLSSGQTQTITQVKLWLKGQPFLRSKKGQQDDTQCAVSQYFVKLGLFFNAETGQRARRIISIELLMIYKSWQGEEEKDEHYFCTFSGSDQRPKSQAQVKSQWLDLSLGVLHSSPFSSVGIPLPQKKLIFTLDNPLNT